MSSTWLKSLLEHSERLTLDNCTGQPHPPPPYAAESPFHEVIAEEIAASLPTPVAERLRTASNLAELHHWLAAGAIYRTIQHDNDPELAKRFLDHVASNPAQAVLAYGQAMAEQMAPGLRDRRWHRMDYLGLALQLAAAAVVLLARGIILTALSWWLRGPGTPPTLLAGVLEALAWPPRAFGGFPRTLSGGLGPAIAALLLALEAACAPFLFEALRRLPARIAHITAPLAWRTDTFYLLWFAQAGFWTLWAVVATFGGAGGILFGARQALTARLLAAGLCVLALASAAIAASSARRVPHLGTNPPTLRRQ